MHHQKIDHQIAEGLKCLSLEQKEELLDYIAHLPKPIHSTRIRRRKALKQIQQGIQAANNKS